LTDQDPVPALLVGKVEDLFDFLDGVPGDPPLPASADPEATEVSGFDLIMEGKEPFDIARVERVPRRTIFACHPVRELLTAYVDAKTMPLSEAERRCKELDVEVSGRYPTLSMAEVVELKRASEAAWKTNNQRTLAQRRSLENAVARKAKKR
jgi:hypothetical protein